jgi:HEAT repeat protein
MKPHQPNSSTNGIKVANRIEGMAAEGSWIKSAAHFPKYGMIANNWRKGLNSKSMISGDEPSLGGEAYQQITGREPGLTGEAALLHLLELVKHPDPQIRLKAAFALSRQGDSHAVDSLIEALGDESFSIRRRAAAALGKLGDQRAVAPLSHLMHYDENGSVRVSAAAAIGEIGDPAAVAALTAIMEDGDRLDVRNAAGRALHRISEQHPEAVQSLADDLIARLINGDSRAYIMLQMIQPVSVKSRLIDIMDDPTLPSRTRYHAINVLKEMGAKEITPRLMEFLDGDDLELRYAATRALRVLRDRSDIPGLVMLLDHADWRVRRAAADILGKRKAQSALPKLNLMLSESQAEVRRVAAEALGNFEYNAQLPELVSRESIRRLAGLLDDPVVRVQETAAYALGRIGHPDSVEVLLAVVEDQDHRARGEAMRALSRIWERRPEALDDVLSRLRPFIEDDDGRVSWFARLVFSL